jgi:hypothetical protein
MQFKHAYAIAPAETAAFNYIRVYFDRGASCPVHIASTESGAVSMLGVKPATHAAPAHDLLFRQRLLLTIPIAASGIATSAIKS